MMISSRHTLILAASLALVAFSDASFSALSLPAQFPDESLQGGSSGPSFVDGRQGGRGPGGPPQEIKLVKQFDRDGDGMLNTTERQAARGAIAGQGFGPGRGGRMGPMGFGGNATGSPGRKLTPAEVKSGGSAPLYDMQVLRTLFFQFEGADWEQELMDFHNTDVDLPATLVVDGQTYKDVGIHFRGMSSFSGVPAGLKHSINVSIDFRHDTQQLLGYRTLNLLNSHEDPTFLRSVLYYEAARAYVPAPKSNFVRVAINGESWGVYVNAEQFNKDMIKEWFNTTDGARWKVPGSPGGRGGLEYLGDNPGAYKGIYEIKSKDDPKSWADLIKLCRVLNETPPDQLEAALAPVLDVDGALKFLALEVALVNNDGYWVRASDYSIYEDPKGRFHVWPHDANETFSPGGGPGGPGGPGRGGPGGRGGRGFNGDVPPGMPPPPGGGFGPGGPGRGPGGGGTTLDPLVGINDPSKALRSKLLAVPALEQKYLGYVRDIARRWLDWNTLGPLVTKYQAVIADEVKLDTRKLNSTEEFTSSVQGLKDFAERRRAFLLSYQEK